VEAPVGEVSVASVSGSNPLLDLAFNYTYVLGDWRTVVIPATYVFSVPTTTPLTGSECKADLVRSLSNVATQLQYVTVAKLLGVEVVFSARALNLDLLVGFWPGDLREFGAGHNGLRNSADQLRNYPGAKPMQWRTTVTMPAEVRATLLTPPFLMGSALKGVSVGLPEPAIIMGVIPIGPVASASTITVSFYVRVAVAGRGYWNLGFAADP